ncbi:MAG: hypothetical protein FWD64_09625 [Acidobacteriaceae bacterium]|nr:hypothetical protein [Acidobacteriaceae bacterium]
MEKNLHGKVTETPPEAERIPAAATAEIRRLTHELNNSLEIIVQISYLLRTTELTEPAQDWLRMLDDGVKRAMDTGSVLRSFVRSHSHG